MVGFMPPPPTIGFEVKPKIRGLEFLNTIDKLMHIACSCNNI